MGTININGVTYEGDNISVKNGEVTIDGVLQQKTPTGKISIMITGGQLSMISTDASVEVFGSVQGNVSAGGSVNCDDVGGSITAGGSVRNG